MPTTSPCVLLQVFEHILTPLDTKARKTDQYIHRQTLHNHAHSEEAQMRSKNWVIVRHAPKILTVHDCHHL
jgi:hypothetical protein